MLAKECRFEVILESVLVDAETKESGGQEIVEGRWHESSEDKQGLDRVAPRYRLVK